VVDQLARDFADQPVVFLEHPVDTAQGDRISRWWAAYAGGGSVLLPLVMVDSGYRHSYGSVAFSSAYRAMVEDALARPPEARLEVARQRVGSAYRFDVQVTNLSPVTLGSGNQAALHAIVYEETHVGDTDRFVRGVTSISIPSLPSGTAADYSMTVALGSVNWNRLHSVVLVDYRPGGSTGPYDMLAADLQP